MPKNRIYRAIAYLRISNADSKLGESESLTNQRNIIQDFVAKNPDIELVDEKLDDGVSGLVFDRPQFKEMMEEIMNERVDCVIVKDLSRLGRDCVQTGNHLRKVFPELGIRFVAIIDNIDTKTDNNLSDKLDVTMKTILNDSYSRDISNKTRSALRIKQQNGEYTGACPIYGYQKSPDSKNSLVIDTEISHVVKEIFALKKGGYGANRIAAILNQRGELSPLAYKKAKGLPTPKGGYTDKEGSLWSATTIIRMLKDDTYTGTLTQGRMTTFSYKLQEPKPRPESEWAVVHKAHEPIISKEDFDLVQKLMNLDTRTSPDGENVYPFSGMLVCSCCGSRMVRKTVPRGNRKYVYYACNTGRKNGCTTKMIKEETLMEIVQNSIRAFVSHGVSIGYLLEEVGAVKIVSDLQEEIARKLSNLEEKHGITWGFKTKLYESLMNDLISKEDFRDLNKDYEKELQLLGKEKALLEEEYQKVVLNDNQKPQWIEEIEEFVDMPKVDRRTVVQLLQFITIGETIHLSFRYQDVFDNLLETIRKGGIEDGTKKQKTTSYARHSLARS